MKKTFIAAFLFAACLTLSGCASGAQGGAVWMAYIFLALFLIFFALVTSNIARKKGYSQGGFWIFAFFLPIPALIVVLCLKPRKKRYPNAAENYNQPISKPRKTTSAMPPPIISAQNIEPGQPAGTAENQPGALPEDTLEQELSRISELKKRDYITEEEYQAMRKKILGI
jgi:hypothetical protein